VSYFLGCACTYYTQKSPLLLMVILYNSYRDRDCGRPQARVNECIVDARAHPLLVTGRLSSIQYNCVQTLGEEERMPSRTLILGFCTEYCQESHVRPFTGLLYPRLLNKHAIFGRACSVCLWFSGSKSCTRRAKL